MSGHVKSEIVDFLEGRLSRARTREVERHLAACPVCAADTDHARLLRRRALQQGLVHVSPARIVTLAEGEEQATPSEQKHLEDCEACRTELEWSRPESAQSRQESTPTSETSANPPPSGPPSRRATIPGARRVAGAAAVALATAVVAFHLLDESRSVRALARIEPVPVQGSRPGSHDDPFEGARMRGLVEYREADYQGAVAALEEARLLRPDDPNVLLYLGSALLLLGETDRATAELSASVEAADSPILRDEARWQLANALLARGRAGDAREALSAVAASQGTRAAAAERLLRTLDR